MKKCPRCRKLKAVGPNGYCLPCHQAYNEAWGKLHPGKAHTVTRKSQRHQRREALVKLGGKCIRCGEDDWHCLQIDHINGGGAKELRKVGSAGINRKVLKGMPGYQLLCANCNQKKRYEKGEGVRLV